jgi:hypothetical protein
MPRRRRDAFQRFWAKVSVASTGCWLWTGAIQASNGYPRFCIGGRDGGTRFAHRWAYEFFLEPIPIGLEIDHLCRVRACVNPLHLQVVTHRENRRRSRGHPHVHPRKQAAREAAP